MYTSSFINAAAWLLTVDCITKVGDFDPIFFHTGEDIDYYNRIRYNQFKSGIVPTSKIYHLRSNKGKIPSYESVFFHRYVNLMVYLKNPFIKTSLRKVLQDLIIECLLSLIKGKCKQAIEVWKIYTKLWKNKKKC